MVVKCCHRVERYIYNATSRFYTDWKCWRCLLARNQIIDRYLAMIISWSQVLRIGAAKIKPDVFTWWAETRFNHLFHIELYNMLLGHGKRFFLLIIKLFTEHIQIYKFQSTFTHTFLKAIEFFLTQNQATGQLLIRLRRSAGWALWRRYLLRLINTMTITS